MIAELVIDLGAIRGNVERLSALVKPARFAAVVKANAYGHGAWQVARALENAGADLLACADIEEASVLRAAGVRAQILIFGALSVSELDGLFDGKLTPTISTPGAARATFVERAPRALAALRRNVDALGLSERVTVLGCDALAALRRDDKYDLVFLDPPYAMAAGLAGALSRDLPDVLTAGALVVSESDRRAPLALTLPLLRERRYGDTMIRIHETRRT